VFCVLFRFKFVFMFCASFIIGPVPLDKHVNKCGI
jgi:hypothetical protein